MQINLCPKAFLVHKLHTFLFQHVKHGIFHKLTPKQLPKYRGLKTGNLDLGEFLSSNFVGWLTLKVNIATKEKRSTESKVSIFFPIKSRYIFWYETCQEAQIRKFKVEVVGVRNG